MNVDRNAEALSRAYTFAIKDIRGVGLSRRSVLSGAAASGILLSSATYAQQPERDTRYQDIFGFNTDKDKLRAEQIMEQQFAINFFSEKLSGKSFFEGPISDTMAKLQPVEHGGMYPALLPFSSHFDRSLYPVEHDAYSFRMRFDDVKKGRPVYIHALRIGEKQVVLPIEAMRLVLGEQDANYVKFVERGLASFVLEVNLQPQDKNVPIYRERSEVISESSVDGAYAVGVGTLREGEQGVNLNRSGDRYFLQGFISSPRLHEGLRNLVIHTLSFLQENVRTRIVSLLHDSYVMIVPEEQYAALLERRIAGGIGMGERVHLMGDYKANGKEVFGVIADMMPLAVSAEPDSPRIYILFVAPLQKSAK
jgi:hypothetical protein